MRDVMKLGDRRIMQLVGGRMTTGYIPPMLPPGSPRGIPASALLALLVACGGDQTDTNAAAAPLAAVTLTASDIATVREIELVEGVSMSGSLEPAQTVVVKSQVAGRLRRVHVDRGRRVARGQLLVELDAEAIRGQSASARAAVASAEAAAALSAQRLESAKRLLAAGAISDIELRSSDAANQAATAQLALARAQLAATIEADQRTTIRSPITGVVSERIVEEGEAVKDGDRLLEVVDVATLELQAQVGVDEAMRVRVGLPVTFTIDALAGQSLQGRVARIDPRADPGTRQVGIAARLANPGGRIVAGQFARGRVLTGRATTAIAIPIAAVSDSAGEARVFVIEGGKLLLRPVTLGTRDDHLGLVGVTSGLTGAERILARPVLGAANGLAVTVASDSAARAVPPVGSK
jgi:RND family efflux transporter MFP subunit